MTYPGRRSTKNWTAPRWDSAASAAPDSEFLSSTATLYPSEANFLTVAAPMSVAPPVIITDGKRSLLIYTLWTALAICYGRACQSGVIHRIGVLHVVKTAVYRAETHPIDG
jgi:hypothetical protein